LKEEHGRLLNGIGIAIRLIIYLIYLSCRLAFQILRMKNNYVTKKKKNNYDIF